MVSQADRLMGATCAVYCGRADNDTIAQVVKCTPVIVLHQADEITLFRWHPTCPCSVGGPWEDDMFCFSHLGRLPPPFLPLFTHDAFRRKWVEVGLTRPVSMTTSQERSQKDQICFPAAPKASWETATPDPNPAPPTSTPPSLFNSDPAL